MAMLAEPRRRKRYNLCPRGKALYEDDNRFGTKMLEKMGWSKGNGLGARQDGEKDFVRIRFKNDAEGLGYEAKDDQWTTHEEGFNGLLKSLNGVEDDTEANGKASESEEEARPMGFGFKAKEPEEPSKKKLKEKISGMSLEERSKLSKARVHYQKFTRGKDLSQYSEKDLANIFGKKATEDIAVPVVIEEPKEEKNVSPNFGGVQTVSTGLSVSDYFKQKMEAIKNKLKNGSTQQNGVGEAQVNGSEVVVEEAKAENGSDEPLKKKKKKNAESPVESPITEPKKKKKSKSSSQDEAAEVVESQPAEGEETIVKKKKKKSKSSSQDEAEEVEESKPAIDEETIVKNKKKSNLSSQDEAAEVVESQPAEIEETIVKKKKKKSKSSSQDEAEEVEESQPAKVEETIVKKKKKKSKSSSQDEAVEVEESKPAIDEETIVKKKKKKDKADKKEETSETVVETIEILDEPSLKKKKSKKSKTTESEIILIDDNSNSMDENLTNKKSETVEELVKKKKNKSKNCEENQSVAGDANGVSEEIESPPKKKKKSKLDKANTESEDTTQTVLQAPDSSENSSKKKKKSKVPVDEPVPEDATPKPKPASDAVEETSFKKIRDEGRKHRDTDVSAVNRSFGDKSDQSADEDQPEDLLSLEEINEKLKSFNTYTISQFCSEKFQLFDMYAFRDSTLSQILGYATNANIELKVVENRDDEKRILDLWKNKANKYKISKKNIRYPKAVKRTTIRAVKKRVAFLGI